MAMLPLSRLGQHELPNLRWTTPLSGSLRDAWTVTVESTVCCASSNATQP